MIEKKPSPLVRGTAKKEISEIQFLRVEREFFRIFFVPHTAPRLAVFVPLRYKSTFKTRTCNRHYTMLMSPRYRLLSRAENLSGIGYENYRILRPLSPVIFWSA